jgi:hypothetical protein
LGANDEVVKSPVPCPSAEAELWTLVRASATISRQ